MDDAILVERQGHVLRLIMNRPDKHNALKFKDLYRMTDILHEAEEDDDVKVIILKGAGPSFCAGHDYNDALNAYQLEPDETGKPPRRPSQRRRLLQDRKLGDCYMAFQNSLKPIIAQVHGHCTGVGLYLVELVDLAVCSHDAKFSHAEQRLGLAGNTWHLNSQILMYGAKKARELFLLGDNFDGPEAERLGLVNRSVAPDELSPIVEDWATRISKHARDSLVTGKAMHQMAIDSLGGSQQFYRGYVGHTLGTNLRYEPDEFNVLKERRNDGTTATFKKRDGHFD